MRAVAILPAFLVACSSAPAPRPELDHALLATIDPTDFPGAAAILAGFDAPDPDGDCAFRVGDTVLFALLVHDGERTERRLLRLRTTKVTPVLTGHMDDGRVVRVREHSTVSVDVTGG